MTEGGPDTPYCGQGETLLDETGWREEAEGVIHDIAAYVQSIVISGSLPATSCQIFLNLVTREEESYTISLNAQGFSVVGRGLDRAELETEPVYETPYALLDNLSPAYRQAFGNDLMSALGRLQDEQQQAGLQ